MQHHIAYLNEWGNNLLDFSKNDVSVLPATTHFIVSAITAGNGSMSASLPVLEAISSKYFNGGRIDSEVIGNDHGKRKDILEDLDEIDFKIFAIIVDKRQLSGQGLRGRKFYERVCQLCPAEPYHQPVQRIRFWLYSSSG